MKEDFNKKAVDDIVEAFAARPYDAAAVLTFGVAPQENLKTLAAEIAQLGRTVEDKTRQDLQQRLDEALGDLQAHLVAAEKIIALYNTRWEPLSRDGCINIGEIRRDDFVRRVKVLQETAIAGQALQTQLAEPAIPSCPRTKPPQKHNP